MQQYTHRIVFAGKMWAVLINKLQFDMNKEIIIH